MEIDISPSSSPRREQLSLANAAITLPNTDLLEIRSKPEYQFANPISSQQSPVTRILGRIEALENDLKQERRNYTDEYNKLHAKHLAGIESLQQMKIDFEESLTQSEANIRNDSDQLQTRTAQIMENCTALEARACSMRAEVDAFRTSYSHPRGLADASSKATVDPIFIIAVEDMTVELAKWRMKFLEFPERETPTREACDLDAKIELQALRKEKSKFLKQQGELETKIVSLQAEFVLSKLVEDRLQELLSSQQDQERHDLEEGNTISELRQNLELHSKSMEDLLQQSLGLVQKTGDATSLVSRSNVEQPVLRIEEGVNSHTQGQIQEQVSVHMSGTSSPKPDAPTSRGCPTMGDKIQKSTVSNNTAEKVELKTPTGPKRTLSEFLSGEIDASCSEPQRRRTSLQSCSTRLQDSNRGAYPAMAVERNSHIDNFGKWRPGSAFDQATRQHRLTERISGNPSPREHTSQHISPSTSRMSCKDALYEKPSTQAQSDYLPPSDSGLYTNKTHESSFNTSVLDKQNPKEIQEAPQRGPEVRIPFQAPTPRPKKWQNSVLKRNR